jgi:hypothetical protein
LKSPSLKTPYADILPKLIASVMQTQADIVAALANGKPIESFDDKFINRRFSWLTFYRSRGGINRHLYDGSSDASREPLLTKSLLNKGNMPIELKKLLQAGKAVPTDDKRLFALYVRAEPTRISKLIKSEMASWCSLKPKQNKQQVVGEKSPVSIPSPLRIVEQILTVPDCPSSREFAFLALRNYLVGGLQTTGTSADFADLPEEVLIEAIDIVDTSSRARFNSKGQDKLPSGELGSFHRFFREYLALKGYYDYWFSSPVECQRFFDDAVFYPAMGNSSEVKVSKLKYEFSRREALVELPEASDISNQLWGIPVPIRGADVVFRGGMKFPKRKGLVLAVHGGPGTGKTALALGFGAALAGFGIGTTYFTAEETEADLRARARSTVPATYHRLSFYPRETKEWLEVFDYSLEKDGPTTPLARLEAYFEAIKIRLDASKESQSTIKGVVSPCRQVIVLDGLHDLVNRSAEEDNGVHTGLRSAFHRFIETCKELEALVILTAGDNWKYGAELDYLVDTAMQLSHDTSESEGGKPERRINLSKARHQSCSHGNHSFQIAGEKGVRFTPQINYCLDLASIWKTRLSNEKLEKRVLVRVAKKQNWSGLKPRLKKEDFVDYPGIRIFGSSSIFINGTGSGGKAGLALKIASAPTFNRETNAVLNRQERVLVISFLYPAEYYENVHKKISLLQRLEYVSLAPLDKATRIKVVHFYPGYLRTATLFNRVRWLLEEGELSGEPYTTVVIDGLHNVFIQFPHLEKNQVVWPQLYSMLRQTDLMIITTHTVLTYSAIANDGKQRQVGIDDYRSDPLRHAVVQKTDFSFEVDPIEADQGQSQQFLEYELRALSSIEQPLPNRQRRLFWHREELFLYDGGVAEKNTGESVKSGKSNVSQLGLFEVPK